MARYKSVAVGVLDTLNGNVWVRPHGEGWLEYLAWLAAGNSPDPVDPPPAVPLPERRARRRVLTQAFMRAAASTGVDAAGTHFRFDDYDLGVLHGAALLVLSGATLPAGFVWRDVTGALVSINAATLKTIVQQLAERQYRILRKRWDIEAAIDASSNPEGINADDYGGL